MRFLQKNNNGFTLAEVVVYIAILTLTLVSVMLAITGIMRTYRATEAQQRIGRAAAFSLSRMTYEIQTANAADTVTSNFGSHPGALALSLSNPTRTVRFYVENGTLKFDENGVYAGDLTPEKVFVSSFIVRHLQVDSSSAIRIELTLDARAKSSTTTQTFYSTMVMRGSYAQ